MSEGISHFFISTAQSLNEALGELIWPALFFVALALIVKKKSCFADIKRAVPEMGLNVKIVVFNTLLVIPLIALLSELFSQSITNSGLVLINPETWANIPQLIVIALAVFLGDFVAY